MTLLRIERYVWMWEFGNEVYTQEKQRHRAYTLLKKKKIIRVSKVASEEDNAKTIIM